MLNVGRTDDRNANAIGNAISSATGNATEDFIHPNEISSGGLVLTCAVSVIAPKRTIMATRQQDLCAGTKVLLHGCTAAWGHAEATLIVQGTVQTGKQACASKHSGWS